MKTLSYFCDPKSGIFMLPLYMEKKGTHMRLSPQNFWCVNCAVMGGIMRPADHIIWDDLDKMSVPLCADCHSQRGEFVEMIYTFSEN